MGPQPVEDENFCLRWNDYEKKYAETFRTLREDEHFADVTLACEGHAVKAHRIILCACSGYFGHILRTINPAQHPVLLLSDVRPTDLTALMDFIYFGQVNITQDSLQSFLKVADKLKIKGLCERAMIAPEPPLQHATITLPIKDEKKTTNAASLAHTNFDSLLGRTNYMGEPPAQQLSPGQAVSLAQPSLPPLRHSVTSSAPPAHQSPKHTSTPSRGTTRPPEQQQYMIISSPKKAKYSLGGGGGSGGGGGGQQQPTSAAAPHASILRNQLVTKDPLSNHVEVKSEPLPMMAAHHEDVPGNVGSVSVTEFITSEGDLSLPSLPHGMSTQFMFPPDPSPAGDPGAIAPQPAALVTIQPEKEGGYSRVVSVSMPEHITSHPSPSTPTSHHTYKEEGRGEEPQDLTPMQDVSNTQVSSHSSPDTPGKKERNSRKQCPYCHKDFHEMSLKRHIKDVHFRNQNTYVICPQCCKQYASQNSLYSHLNRVHGVKKEEIQMQLASGGTVGQLALEHRGEGGGHAAGGDVSGGKYEGQSMMVGHRGEGEHGLLIIRQHGVEEQYSNDGHDGMVVRQHNNQESHTDGIIVRHGQETSHEGIMDLAQHSDHSN